MSNSTEISNLDFPVSCTIREALHDLTEVQCNSIIDRMTEDEFVSHRVDIYLAALETAMHSGYDEAGAKEIALKECLAGISIADE